MHMETPPPPASTGEPRSSFLEEKAFKSRTVLVFGAINDQSAADTVRRLIALDADAPHEPIDMLVSSPGGHLESGDTVHDVIRFISAPVRMIGTGWVGSAATHLFLSVPKERRFCLPQTRFLIHQPSGGAGGQATGGCFAPGLRQVPRSAAKTSVADGWYVMLQPLPAGAHTIAILARFDATVFSTTYRLDVR